jgi:hypothetical protein
VEELIPMTMFVCIAMVMILRPISKRVGGLLEAMTRERMQQNAPAPAVAADPQLTRIATLLEHVSRRMDLMEERLDFTERLVGTRQGLAAPAPDSVGPFGDVRLVREPAQGIRG